MTKPYEYYHGTESDMEHVHVEIPYAHLDGDYGHMTRIAEVGVKNIIKDGGWYLDGKWITNANFIYNWGSGPRVALRDGKVGVDTRPKEVWPTNKIERPADWPVT